MKAVQWYDNQGVHILAAGGSGQKDRIVRRDDVTAEQAELMAPRVIKDYQIYMGGVDVHDQLRLQRCYKKYYKSLFLDLIDLVVVNAFIVYKCRRVKDGKRKATHVEFLKKLHLELIQLKPDDWTQLIRHRGMNHTPTKQRTATTAHVPIKTNEWIKDISDATRKRRQRACLFGTQEGRRGERWRDYVLLWGRGCKLKTATKNAQAARVFLCNKIKAYQQRRGNPMLRDLTPPLEKMAPSSKAQDPRVESRCKG
ncbi:LOW QUALITY PROTEIN: hypothetical protein PHMEG_00027797 [Phytophthora megakarya]|uniref:PiggyBac transposable element-derived protein domain-containing protein n=1 Tax=Phytophthora megakarya TaxID=4795 RepID=A0A225V631_9STRA|nr:LOW QUALITY PROTEIN: hypothetical protein PHMEG_00027797 [Phytophthora megakarya]